MDLFEATKARKSIRAYKADPVPEEVLRELMEMATHAPTSVNSQPCEYYIISGDVLNELKKACVEEFRAGTLPNPDVPVAKMKGTAPGLTGIYRDRQVALAKQMFKLLGIAKGDKQAMQDWGAAMYRFYDAPAVIVIAIDDSLSGGWPLIDTGVITYSIALTAEAYGLGTCIMRGIVDYPEHIRKLVDVPDSKQIVIGIAIGYPDSSNPVNDLRSEREDIDTIVTFVS
ncbi:nitroreductase [Thermodesulfobacteriota bacterium]